MIDVCLICIETKELSECVDCGIWICNDCKKNHEDKWLNNDKK